MIDAFRGGNDKLDGGADRDIVSGRDGAAAADVAGDIETSSVGMNWSVSRSVTVSGGVTTYSRTYNDTAFLPVSGGGDDVIYGGAGADWLFANEGNDWIDGGSGEDVVFGEAGSDELFGGVGNDKLFGDSASVPLNQHGDDYLDGEDGDDEMNGDGGNDTLFGGEGHDTERDKGLERSGYIFRSRANQD